MLPSIQSTIYGVMTLLFLIRLCYASSSRYSAAKLASFELWRSECLQGSFSGEPSLVGDLNFAKESNNSCLRSNGLSAFAYSTQNIGK